jgi:hypothetical protein
LRSVLLLAVSASRSLISALSNGPKNWTIDGAAFFMADKLMKAGGWIIFDDYDWT